MENQPTHLTPEIVSAILRDHDSPLYPSRITVFCDDCGTEFTGEFMVSAEQTGTERLEVARAHLRSKGWQCDESGDYCPQHKARTNTPDQINEDGSRTIRMKRCCNGCGQVLGDVDGRDVDARGNLTDVRAECPTCRVVLELEAAGCRTWQLTPHNYGRIDAELDRDGVFAKQFTEWVDDKVTTVGMRIGIKPGHVVARFGDWIIRHPDGGFTVHHAPGKSA